MLPPAAIRSMSQPDHTRFRHEQNFVNILKSIVSVLYSKSLKAEMSDSDE